MWTYSPREVYINMSLAYTVKGTSEDIFLRIVKDQDSFKTEVGGAGGTSRTYNPNDNYTIYLTLPQTSPSNHVMSLLHTLDETTRRGAFPFFAKDFSGNSLFFSPITYIERRPDVSFGSRIEDYEWKLKATDMVFAAHGNSKDGGLLSNDLDTIIDLVAQYGSNMGVI